MRLEKIVNEIIDRIDTIIDETVEDGYDQLPSIEEYTKSGYPFDSYDEAETVTVYDKEGRELNNVSDFVTRKVNEKIDFHAYLNHYQVYQ